MVNESAGDKIAFAATNESEADPSLAATLELNTEFSDFSAQTYDDVEQY